MRFLHLADVHLDTAFRCRSEDLRRELREASWRALERGVDEAIRRELDAVLIAGDLFDGDRLSVRTERFLGETLARLDDAGITVVYVTGNHDPGGPSSVQARVPWPSNVRVIDGPGPQRIEIPSRQGSGDPAGYVTGAGHDSARVTEDLSRAFPAPEGHLPEIALLHTQVGGARGASDHDPYAPSELARLRRAGYDYWALGHVHARQELSDDPPVHYPGNLQGRHPGETGAKGGLVVELTGGGSPVVEFVELAPVRWETIRLSELVSERRLSSISRRIERAWLTEREEDPGPAGTRWIVRVELAGPSPLHRELRSIESHDELREDLLPRLDLLDLEVRSGGLRPLVRVDDYLDREDALGEVLRAVRTLSNADGPSPSERLGLSADELAGAPDGDRRALDAYLRELLDGGEEELLSVLLDPEDS